MTDATPDPAKKDTSGKSCALIAGLGCGIPVLLIAIVLISGAMFGDSSNNDEAQSIVACEQQVKASLKAPSTASLSSTARGSDGRYTVTGQVDAENSFGAKVRNTYECSVAINGDYAAAKITSWR